MIFDAFQLVRPCQGQRVAGDVAVTKTLQDGLLAVIVDVSGHGPKANELAVKLEHEIMEWPSQDLDGLMRRLDAAAEASRGAAAGVAHFQEAGALRYVGVGNTRIQRFGANGWKGVSRDGVLGSRMPSLRPDSTDLDEGDVVALFTDGLSERISPSTYPRMGLETPPMIANKLITLFGKSYDDASCIVIKCRA